MVRGSMDWLNQFLLSFIPLFVAMDPVGLVPVYLGMTQGVALEKRRHVARQAVVTAALVAVGFMFLGKWIFRTLGISVGDFQIAGGLILLAVAARELLVEKHEAVVVLPENFGVVPLGLPLIVGPGTITTLLILMDTVGIRLALLGFVANLLLVILALGFAERILKAIGATGLRAVSKIIALLLMAIAVSMIRRGWQAVGVPTP